MVNESESVMNYVIGNYFPLLPHNLSLSISFSLSFSLSLFSLSPTPVSSLFMLFLALSIYLSIWSISLSITIHLSTLTPALYILFLTFTFSYIYTCTTLHRIIYTYTCESWTYISIKLQPTHCDNGTLIYAHVIVGYKERLRVPHWFNNWLHRTTACFTLI